MNLINFLFTQAWIPHRLWFPILLGVTLFLLSACSTTRVPIQITEITVAPEPLIGEVAIVHFEFMSTEDGPDTTLEITLQDGIKLVSGNLLWQGSIVANQVETHEISICTQFEGVWRIQAFVWSNLPTGGSYESGESVFLDVSENTARVLTSNEYEPKSVSPPPYGSSRITPLPELTIPVCP